MGERESVREGERGERESERERERGGGDTLPLNFWPCWPNKIDV